MMNCGELPVTLEICGIAYEIRTDFRAIFDIFAAFNDNELKDWEKLSVMLTILYVHSEEIPRECYQEAIRQANWFIDCGIQENKNKPRTMDWEKDANIIFPAINHIAGREVRNPKVYTHWWTFIGYYMEIREGVFSTVLRIRQKKEAGESLEKWEAKFYRENQELCMLQITSKEEAKELEFIKKLVG